MTEELTPETFDLTAALSGQTYPTEEVKVPLDRKAARDVLKLRADVRTAHTEGDDEAEDAARSAYKKAVEQVQGSCLTITVRGLSTPESESLGVTTKEILGEKKPKDEDQEVFSRRIALEAASLRWVAHIDSIKNSEGAETEVSQENIKVLLSGLADSNLQLIQSAIENLDREATTGFEATTTDLDF